MLFSFVNIIKYQSSFGLSYSEIVDREPDNLIKKFIRRFLVNSKRISVNRKLVRAGALHGSYSPQPFEIFARAYLIHGDKRNANRILRTAQNMQWFKRSEPKDHYVPYKRNFLTNLFREFESFLVKIFGYIYGSRFGFGLSPRKAIVTLVSCITIFFIFSYNNPHLKPLKGSFADDAIANDCKVAEDGLWERLLYSIDTFVPLIELRKECAFTIEPSAWIWSLLDAYFSIVGWIITSVTIVTLTGLVRKDITSQHVRLRYLP